MNSSNLFTSVVFVSQVLVSLSMAFIAPTIIVSIFFSRVNANALGRHLGQSKLMACITGSLFILACTICAFSTGLTCEGVTHLVGFTYPFCKFWTYLFLFLKNRLVRPLDKLTLFEKILLFATTLVILFAVCCGIWVQGKTMEVLTLNQGTLSACYPDVPPSLAIIMIAADVLVSIGYIILFTIPLRNLAQHDPKYHKLIWKNFIACIITVLGTVLCMSWILLCDYNIVSFHGYSEFLKVTIYAGGTLDINISIWTILLLSWKKSNRITYEPTAVGSEEKRDRMKKPIDIQITSKT